MGCLVAHSLEEAVATARQACDNDIFVIGGGQIYKEALPVAQTIYITRVHAYIGGIDTYFPRLPDQWRLMECEHRQYADRHAYPYTFEVWKNWGL